MNIRSEELPANIMRDSSDNPLSEEEPMDMGTRDISSMSRNYSTDGGRSADNESETMQAEKEQEATEAEEEEEEEEEAKRNKQGHENEDGNEHGNDKEEEEVEAENGEPKEKKRTDILGKIDSYIRSQWIYNAPVMVDTLYHIKRFALIYSFCNYALFPVTIAWYSQHAETHPTSSVVHISLWAYRAIKWIIPSFVHSKSSFIRDILSNPPKLWQLQTIQTMSSVIAVTGCFLWSVYSWRYFTKRIRDWNNRYHEYDNSTDPYLSTLILEQWFLLNNRIFEKQSLQQYDEEEDVDIDDEEENGAAEVSVALSNVSKYVHRLQNSQDVMLKPMEHLQEHYHHHSNEVNLSRDLSEMIASLGLFPMAQQKNCSFVTIIDLTCATQHYKVYSSMQTLSTHYTVKNIAIARYKHRTCVVIFHTFESENDDTNQDTEGVIRQQYVEMQQRMMPVMNRHQVWEETFINAVCARFLDLKSKDNVWFVMKAHRCAYQNVMTFRVADGSQLQAPLIYHQQIGWDPSFTGRWDLWCVNVHFRK